MKRSTIFLLGVLAACVVAPVQAQTLSPAWEAYRQKQRQAQQGTAPRPAAPMTAPASAAEQVPLTGTSSGYTGAAPVPYVPPPTAQQRVKRDENRSSAFIGLQAGRGWVYEDVDQKTYAFNAGYRWRAGPIAQVGIEAAHGRLDDYSNARADYPKVSYTSLGATARFNFGRNNPWHGIVRSGVFTAETEDRFGDNIDLDGGYASLGIGVDVNRHFNVNLLYTGYIYFDDYDGIPSYEDVNRADQVTLGLEVRF